MDSIDRRKFLTMTAAATVGASAGIAVTEASAEARAKKTHNGQVVLITGATSGIGEATAHAFAARGAKVVFCGRRVELGKAVEKSIRAKGGVATYIRADVREENQMRDLVGECKKLYGGLHIAFNNAGIAPAPKNLEDLSFEEVANVMQTNFYGVFFAMKYEIPLIKESGGGSIINCGSYSSDHGMEGFVPYSSSKHAMSGITKVAALELAKSGITINSVNPYCVDTPMNRNRAKFLGVPIEELARNRPNQKMSAASDVADLVVYLSSKENRILHGQALDLSMGVNIKT